MESFDLMNVITHREIDEDTINEVKDINVKIHHRPKSENFGLEGIYIELYRDGNPISIYKIIIRLCSIKSLLVSDTHFILYLNKGSIKFDILPYVKNDTNLVNKKEGNNMQTTIKSNGKKVMFSQPMAGLSEDQIVTSRNKAIEYLENKGYEIVNTLFTDEWYSQESMKKRGVRQIPVCFLAKSLENMALCDTAYFAKGWENARGCKIEHEVAKNYGLEIIYESEDV